jgi:hypothetical protein
MKMTATFLSVAAGLAVLTSAPVRADDKPVTIAATYKAADKESYKVELHVTIPQGEVNLTTTSTATVKEIKPNGDVVSELTTDKTVISINGSEMDGPAQPPVTSTHDKLGKLVDMKTDIPDGAFFTPEVARYIVIVNGLILPEKPVVTNDKWETEMDNPMVKGKKITIKDTYLGTDKVDSVDLWKVQQTISTVTDDAGAKSTSDITYWLDPTNGHIVKAEGKVTGIPTTQGMSVDWTTKRTPAKPDKPAEPAKAQ